MDWSNNRGGQGTPQFPGREDSENNSPPDSPTYTVKRDEESHRRNEMSNLVHVHGNRQLFGLQIMFSFHPALWRLKTSIHWPVV